jgi:hypothetical protein
MKFAGFFLICVTLGVLHLNLALPLSSRVLSRFICVFGDAPFDCFSKDNRLRNSHARLEQYVIASSNDGEFLDEEDSGRDSNFEDDGDDDEDSSKDKSSAEIQFMITNKMRHTLVNDLGYLSEEVDEMEPQVLSSYISFLSSS